MMKDIEIITTGDGSNSLLNITLNETYHSKHGAVQESDHVFIKNGLSYFLKKTPIAGTNILEIGFGTGLNALLTLQHIQGMERHVHYTTLETNPLEENLWSQLNYGFNDRQSNFEKIHQASWTSDEAITSNFILRKIKESVQEATLNKLQYHIIYFDAFGPNKQPDMWTLDVLRKVVVSMAIDSVFVTYCARGQLKRDLRELGLFVESLEGPPGKKEMIRALKQQ